MTTRTKYNRVKQLQKKQDKPTTDILMRMSPTYGRYVSRALTLFLGEGKSFIVLKAGGRLMYRALWVAEVLKRKIVGLHQITEIKQREIVDVYQPKEEGLLKVQQKRYLSIIEITLTKQPTNDQKKSVGYQPPLKLSNEEYLTKQKWQKHENDRKNRLRDRQPEFDRAQVRQRYQDDNHPHRDDRYDRQRRGTMRRRGRN